MDVVVIFLGFLALSAAGIFMVFQPRVMGPQRRALGAFNGSMYVIALVLCLAFTFLMRSNYAIPEDQFFVVPEERQTLWRVLAMGGSFCILTLLFFFGWVARNFWIFKPPSIVKKPW